MKDAIQLYNTSSVKIPIETKDGVYTVLASDIISIEVQGRIITIHSLQGDYTSVQRFDYWKKTLTMPCFFQTHRSFIVNMKHVTNFDHSLVYLCDKQTTAYLTKRKYSSFKEAYFLYLESTR
jgi:two-component system LytT family response regulator